MQLPFMLISLLLVSLWRKEAKVLWDYKEQWCSAWQWSYDHEADSQSGVPSPFAPELDTEQENGGGHPEAGGVEVGAERKEE